MSPENASGYLTAFERRHREGQEAFNRGDFAEAFAALAPDIEWQALPTMVDAGLLQGREAVIRYFQELTEVLEWQVEAQEFIDAGPRRVLIRQRGVARGRKTGISDVAEFFQLWEMGPGGLVVRVREFEERQAALAAVEQRE